MSEPFDATLEGSRMGSMPIGRRCRFSPMIWRVDGQAGHYFAGRHAVDEHGLAGRQRSSMLPFASAARYFMIQPLFSGDVEGQSCTPSSSVASLCNGLRQLPMADARSPPPGEGHYLGCLRRFSASLFCRHAARLASHLMSLYQSPLRKPPP